MTTATLSPDLLIRADLYRLLSHGFSHPSNDNLFSIVQLLDALLEQPLKRDIKKTLKNLHVSLTDKDAIRHDFSRLFLKGNVPTTESFCLVKYNAFVDVAAFYKAFGMTPKQGDAPDALTYELDFASAMLTKLYLAPDEEKKETVTQAYGKFLNEHLAAFAKKFAETLGHTQMCKFYTQLTALLDAHIKNESNNIKIN